MEPGKHKLFRDPVHDYIAVPHKVCSAFIDTPIFQRLRHVEQTSMRPLYPSAHHDRFSHSLGVYHLATRAFDHLVRNSNQGLFPRVDLRVYRPVFEIAALMHDCGHSPFSHTFEPYYNRESRAEKFLLAQVSKKFSRDYQLNYNLNLKGPAPHEMFSAAIFLKHYATTFHRLYRQQDPELVARMVTGCTHQPARNMREQIENCLILLLNGSAIDVDKLDYVVRDTWASGVNNVSIDLVRLLSALTIGRYRGRLVPAFRKSALSVVQSVVDGRNYLYTWVFCHHTVIYYDELLKSAVEALSRLVSPPDASDKLLNLLFSKEAFERPVRINGTTVFLPCDGDVRHLLKQHVKDIPELGEILSRRPKRIPLWKTKAEFDLHFRGTNTMERSCIRKQVSNILSRVIREKRYREMICVLPVTPKTLVIEPNGLYIAVEEKVIPFTDFKLTPETSVASQEPPFFYVFIPRQCQDRVRSCIRALTSQKYY